MSKTLLLYERAVPITKTRHARHSVRPSDDFGFAREINSMPLTAQEFRIAAREFPIVFAGTGEQVMPAVLLGFGPHENVFVDADGKWQAKYIPAFARRYPYVFSSGDQGKTLLLCIDEEFPGLNTDDAGERLFTDDGEQTNYLSNVLNFHKDFQLAHQRTLVFCNRLVELELLEPMQAQLRFGSGEQRSISGFQAVSRGKLKALKGDKLAELNRVDELELIFLHLQSLHNIDEVASHSLHIDESATASKPEAGKTAPKSTAGASNKKTNGAARKTAAKASAKKAARKKAARKKTAGKNGSGN